MATRHRMRKEDVLETSTLIALGHELYDLERAARSREPISDAHPDLDVHGAYAIQEAYSARRMQDDGARLIGRKIGCTSNQIQQMFGIDQPDFGQIFDDMVVPDGGTLSASALVLPMVEPEIAFILEADLSGPGVTPERVLEATRVVLPCLEIIDSRIRDWNIRFVDTVADNGSSSRCVFGSAEVAVDGRDLAAVEVEFLHNGAVVASSTGAAALGHPAASVAWLANALGELGAGLRTGEYVLSGSLTSAIRAHPGDTFQARFTDLGSVSVRFSD
jgi:2-keto-4-pentenoate hydratase